jgi:hypothetical protein
MHGSALDARKGFSTFEAEFHPHVGQYMRSIHSFSSVDDNSGSESSKCALHPELDITILVE